MDTSTIEIILLGSFGATLQELLHWYGLRFKLEQKRYRAILGSLRYGVVVALMVVSAGIVTWVWFGDEVTPLKHLLLFGFTFPLILKKAGESFVNRSPEETLGGKKKEDGGVEPLRNFLRDYL